MEFKFTKELIKALYKIRDAISGNSEDTVSNATLFDAIKMLYDKDYDESFMPVAIINKDFIVGMTEESEFLLLKETPIDTKLEEDSYALLYDKSTELPLSIAFFEKKAPTPFKLFGVAPFEHTIEINGTTYYYYTELPADLLG